MGDESATVSRRRFLSAASGAGLLTAVGTPRAGTWITGSDAPEKRELRIGFMPLTDCAPVVIAAVKGFDAKYGVRIVPSREASWAAVRDKLVGGTLDAAHVLYGLVYGVAAGIGGPRKDMAVLMTLNQNGQAITLSQRLHDSGAVDGHALARLASGGMRRYVLAQTFPTGTHAMWLYYWLGAHGLDPREHVRSITVPPPQMVAQMRAGTIDGCCVGEPWNALAIDERIGFTVATSQDVWTGHPEKVLGTTSDWVERHPNTARALTAAVLEAARWIDASPRNREEAARTIADRAFVDAPADAIVGRMLGDYDDGRGRRWKDANAMRFFADGAVSFPYLSDGMWFLTQHRRWGLLAETPDYLGIARAVNRIDVYADAAAAANVPLPSSPMRSARLIDGVSWNGEAPERYATAFAVRAIA